jgi:ribosome biogenesis GTPase / thiamine phosphate phosphatase
MKLEDLGFDDWFSDGYTLPENNDYKLARIISVDKNSFHIRNEKTETPAELTGKLIYETDSSIDYPTVGDWVRVQYFNEGTFAIIHEVLPRKSLLKRKTSGNKIDHQLIAANIDFAFIVQSADNDFNIARLERYLTMVNEANIEPVILLSKVDLISMEELEQKISNIKNINHNKYEIIDYSNKTKHGINRIKDILKPSKTYCFIGSSGVGKTTLINNLIGNDIYLTGEVRKKDGKGKHVTTRRQLIVLKDGGLLIDSPGMRELASIDAKTGLGDTFSDIAELAGKCKFRNCTHSAEPGCAVLEAISQDRLDKKHFQNYLKLLKEINYNEMAYLEKRKKDRDFGKFIKQVMKNKKL